MAAGLLGLCDRRVEPFWPWLEEGLRNFFLQISYLVLCPGFQRDCLSSLERDAGRGFGVGSLPKNSYLFTARSSSGTNPGHTTVTCQISSRSKQCTFSTKRLMRFQYRTCMVVSRPPESGMSARQVMKRKARPSSGKGEEGHWFLISPIRGPRWHLGQILHMYGSEG